MNNFLSFDCQFRYPDGFELDYQLNAGTGITAICGPSGSGKTTVLSLIAGLHKPDQGRITIGGQTIVDTSNREFVAVHKRRIGFLFQEPRLFPHLSIKANILYGGRRSNSTQQLDLNDLSKVFDIVELMNRKPAQLSGGQKQRVALARAIIQHPRLLLLDEPLNSVEPELSQQILTHIERTVNEFEIPVLLVSHNQQLVESFAHETFQIARGKNVI